LSYQSYESISLPAKSKMFIFQKKRFGKVCMNEEWGSCEEAFKN
jgi:hypothetical protein